MAGHLLDTNIALRSANSADSEHELVVRAVSALIARGEPIYLTAQVIIEFWAVATRPANVNGLGWDLEFVAAEVERLLDQFPLLEEGPAILPRWMQLVTTLGIQGKQVHDARLVAVMLHHGISHVVTLNVDHFRRFGGITPVHPSALAGAPEQVE
jgi:predicted nucleic acid-binding protein